MKQYIILCVKLLVAAAVLTVIGLFVLSLLSYRFYWNEKQMEAGVYVTYGVICAVTGIITGKVMKHRRFLWGALIGLCYYILLLIISSIVSGGMPDNSMHVLVTMMICIVCGMAGGMIGRPKANR